MSVVLVVPDLQIPFEHIDALDFCKEIRDAMDIDLTINIGDEVDFYSISDYIKSTKAMSWAEEFDLAKERLQKWYKEFPKTKVCISNHTWRPYKKMENIGIPEVFARSIEDVLDAPPGWQWRHRWVIDGVNYEHGDSLPANPDRAWRLRLQNTVVGHHHSKYSTTFYRGGDQRYFMAYAGCLIDESKYAFQYNKNPNAQLGAMVVEHGVPLMIPMLTDEHNRWTGKLTL